MAASTYPLSDESQSGHHNHDFTLQKYLLLQEQHESLRQNIRQLQPLEVAQGAFNTATMSPVGSPTSTHSTSSLQSSPYSSRSPSMSRSRSRGNTRRSSLPAQSRANCGIGLGLDTVLDESTVQEVALEEAKLSDVNEGIKRALTELLNCEAVRNDRSLRSWVQSRLMETERELRLGRRRRSAPGSDY